MLRGVFHEGFDTGRTEKLRDRDAFLAGLVEAAGLASPTEASLAAEAALRTLRRHNSGGQVDQVVSQLPQAIGAVVDRD